MLLLNKINISTKVTNHSKQKDLKIHATQLKIETILIILKLWGPNVFHRPQQSGPDEFPGKSPLLVQLPIKPI